MAHPDAARVECDPVLCLGESGRTASVQRPGGTDHRVLPYNLFSMKPAREGRFGVGSFDITVASQLFVWDRFTGEAGAAVAAGGHGFERTVVTWPDLRGGLYLLDLKAIR